MCISDRSQTLLDPCKDDIWNVHIKLSENCQIEALTMQGKEYIRTFKLNRKSYVVRRRTIETQQTELREKLKEYEEIVATVSYTHLDVYKRQGRSGSNPQSI